VGVTTADGTAAGETEMAVTTVCVTMLGVTTAVVKADETTVGKKIRCTVVLHLATSTVVHQVPTHRRRDTCHQRCLALPMSVWTIGHQMLLLALLERREAPHLHPNGPDHTTSMTSTSSQAPLRLQMHAE